MKLLLVEDDKELNRTLTYQLEKRRLCRGFLSGRGRSLLLYGRRTLRSRPSDRMLPEAGRHWGADGNAEKGDMTPVIMLTAWEPLRIK